jgi:hypothetical protein
MTLIVTPGAPDADSYTALADADAYFTARGIATWTGTDAVKEQALRRATTYLDNQYRSRWVGVRVNETQSLAWPRQGRCGAVLYDSDDFQIAADAIPVQLRDACIEVALLTLTGVVLEPRLERGGQVKSIGKSVGPLRKDVVYMDGAPVMDRLIVVEGLLRGLVTSTPGASAGNVNLVRA